MKPRYAVILSSRVQREIVEAARWWADHGSPLVVETALAAVLDRLERFPKSAPRVWSRGRWTTTRRAQVDPIGLLLYYRPNDKNCTIWARCLWHQHRRPPRL